MCVCVCVCVYVCVCACVCVCVCVCMDERTACRPPRRPLLMNKQADRERISGRGAPSPSSPPLSPSRWPRPLVASHTGRSASPDAALGSGAWRSATAPPPSTASNCILLLSSSSSSSSSSPSPLEGLWSPAPEACASRRPYARAGTRRSRGKGAGSAESPTAHVVRHHATKKNTRSSTAAFARAPPLPRRQQRRICLARLCSGRSCRKRRGRCCDRSGGASCARALSESGASLLLQPTCLRGLSRSSLGPTPSPTHPPPAAIPPSM